MPLKQLEEVVALRIVVTASFTSFMVGRSVTVVLARSSMFRASLESRSLPTFEELLAELVLAVGELIPSDGTREFSVELEELLVDFAQLLVNSNPVVRQAVRANRD
jgi:hypothetical protein